MITCVIMCAIFLVIFTPIIIMIATIQPQEELSALIPACIFLALIVFGPFGGMFIYNCVCYRRVIRAVGNCPAYRVTLDKPHGSYLYRGGVLYYTVEFQTDSGRVTMDTTAIFATYGWLVPFKMSDYNNKDVYVLYDKNNAKVYVIDLVDRIDA
ncbi:MAG: hypothetical protein J1G02_00360 [Clostridiales bacterium]|nr:hypothetical protein [Clostridiales bacterium]